MKYLAISILSCFFFVQEAWGHGAMYYPMPWWATKDCSPDQWNPYPVPWKCGFGKLDLGDTGCTAYTGLHEDDLYWVEEHTAEGSPPGCAKYTGLDSWYTNFTFVEERTIDDKFIDTNTIYSHWVTEQLHPWNSPGAAPTFGNGCGANGGNPFPRGCLGEDKMYGRCCAGQMDGWGCGGFVGGKTAIEQYEDGFFHGTGEDGVEYWPRVTYWERGTNQEVFWNSNAYHRGGYAYRVCKVQDLGHFTSGITEECFQKGHLKFAGDTTWIMDNGKFVANKTVKVTEGTTPEGSEWAKINVPHHGAHWIFKDLIEIPEDIEPGVYVLSFRWDCQNSPQVWNSCANIQILP